MTKRMLIDATHAEETRVAVVDNGRLEEFDYESAFRKPLKGNIYLAKVTRVEPSLQAAFVNFGGNRHGFLPFSEIHPDYFRIPIADREALLAEQEEALREAEEEDEALDAEAAQEAAAAEAKENGAQGEDGIEEIEDDKDEIEELGGETDLGEDDEAAEAQPKGKGKSAGKKGRGRKKAQEDDAALEEAASEDDNIGNRVADDEEDDVNGNMVDDSEEEDVDGNREGGHNGQNRRHRGGRGRNNRRGRNGRRGMDSRRTEKYAQEKIDPEQRFRFNLRRRYKIQEVIKRGQIMLVQVSKEERGNKGAAVGSYLSLPGRYCVLMPNSPRAGGVSRKIANYKDRARMREIMKDLEVPKGMSVILRTAGVTRTKAEIKRDLDYLMKLWDNIRELTLESTAPALVYEEADLVKRSVRDHYTREIEEVVVSGKDGFETAKNFMKMLMPSHTKKVVEYTEATPLFHKYKIEKQITDIGETQVTLPSGGYLVINPTEALVSIDVNSGKATKERHIEETALRTNMEAAEEVARQLRLRDLGGLVVIDFIDMEDRRNNGKVERKMREALSGDRARIQMGRISSFGLMELSRQRLSPSLTESQFELCAHCHGLGRVRTADAASILVLRAIEEEGAKGRAAEIMVHVPGAVALYVLNYKRKNLGEMEARYNVAIVMRVDEDLGASGFRVEVSKPVSKDDEDDGAEAEEAQAAPQASEEADEKDGGDSKNRRRRGRRGGRRRGGRDRDQAQQDQDHDSDEGAQDAAASKTDAPAADEAQQSEGADEDKAKKPAKAARAKTKDVKKDAPEAQEPDAVKEAEAAKPKADKSKADKPKKASAKAPVKKDEAKKEDAKPAKAEAAEPKVADVKDAAPAKASNDDKKKAQAPVEKPYEVITETPDSDKKKKGWWNKLID